MTEVLWIWVALTALTAPAIGGKDGVPVPGRRPITKAAFVLGFLPGLVPYLLGWLLAWSIRKPTE